MGNAFTFPLESLVFYALAYAVSIVNERDTKVVSVYGDDIIIHASCYPELREVLSWYGFVVNIEKSYATGRFYESCGKHYFDGIDVTPIYQKNDVTSLSEHIRCFNRVIRWLQRSQGGVTIGIGKDLILQHLNGLRVRSDPMIPFGERDDGYIVPMSMLVSNRYDMSRGYLCKTYISRASVSRSRNAAALLSYKLRAPQYGNPCPRGRDSVFVSTDWIMNKAYFSLDYIRETTYQWSTLLGM
jgi:hypothetical protein